MPRSEPPGLPPGWDRFERAADLVLNGSRRREVYRLRRMREAPGVLLIRHLIVHRSLAVIQPEMVDDGDACASCPSCAASNAHDPDPTLGPRSSAVKGLQRRQLAPSSTVDIVKKLSHRGGKVAHGLLRRDGMSSTGPAASRLTLTSAALPSCYTSTTGLS